MPVREDIDGVEFSIMRGAALDQLDGTVAEFLAHVREAQGEKALLTRADVKPEQLKPFLVSVVILNLEVEDGQVIDVVPRLIGSEVEHFYGAATGVSIKEHSNQAAARRIFRSAQIALDGCEPVIALTKGMMARDQRLTVTSLYFPLSDDGENANQLLGFVKIEQG